MLWAEIDRMLVELVAESFQEGRRGTHVGPIVVDVLLRDRTVRERVEFAVGSSKGFPGALQRIALARQRERERAELENPRCQHFRLLHTLGFLGETQPMRARLLSITLKHRRGRKGCSRGPSCEW